MADTLSPPSGDFFSPSSTAPPIDHFPDSWDPYSSSPLSSPPSYLSPYGFTPSTPLKPPVTPTPHSTSESSNHPDAGHPRPLTPAPKPFRPSLQRSLTNVKLLFTSHSPIIQIQRFPSSPSSPTSPVIDYIFPPGPIHRAAPHSPPALRALPRRGFPTIETPSSVESETDDHYVTIWGPSDLLPPPLKKADLQEPVSGHGSWCVCAECECWWIEEQMLGATKRKEREKFQKPVDLFGTVGGREDEEFSRTKSRGSTVERVWGGCLVNYS